MFGKRFVMLEHVGRKSGEIRRTVLEVVVNDEDAIYVAAAWGEKAQWLQNVRADPNVAFHLGSKKYRCSAEMVPKATAVTLMGRYADEHPKALDKLSSFMLDEPGETAEEQAARIGAAIPFVRLPKRVDGGA